MKLRTVVILGVILFILLLVWASGLYTDYLWFENLGYSPVFLTVFVSQWAIRLAAWAIFFLFLFVNVRFTRDALLNLPNLELREKIVGSPLGKMLTPRNITRLFLLGSLVLSFVVTSYAGGLWLEVRQFFQGVESGVVEPVFQMDASFYLFQLPFLRSLYTFLQTMVVMTILVVGGLYFLVNPPVQVGRRIMFLPHKGQGHLSLLLAGAFLLKAWDYRLQMYELLFSPRGYVTGAGYTDLNANLPALWILFFLALGITGLLIFNIFKRRARLIVISIIVLLAASIGVGSIYPALVQQFRVDPNELAFERPYIERNIQFTRQAFALDQVKTQPYPARQTLDWDDLKRAEGTLDNVRLWDYRPLRQTYNQLQGIRQYYQFDDVDTDRYYINGEYRQVMLAAREMEQRQLPDPAQTWVNLHLQYTHGYGIAMNPVATVTPQGLPEFVVRDLPPVLEGGLELTRPEIYYGELSSRFVIANSRTPEFNYPRGDTNVFAHYDGTGGVQLSNAARRLLYALKFSDYRILISGEITPESRIMFNRRVRQRVQAIAPFLEYDQDPYVVISGGRIFWIIDAYTTSNRYPYSQPFRGINYMRHPVKVVVDAYHGSVDFYVVDPADVVLQTYAGIFPDLFKPMEEMPEDLVAHIRYPEVYFNTQAHVYATYHMTEPGVFYNREDLWQIPNEKYAGTTQVMEPYYTILQIPGESEPEFVLILPFTPGRRDNMIAWMAGRSDGEHYGELLVYTFPKERVIFGPMQVETRIDQNTLISQQLSLWDQRGSRVIRGNLLVLPIDDSILYVEPVFLEADQSQLPELARVIVAFEETVVMEPTLEEALVTIFGTRDVPGVPEPETPDEPVDEDEDEDLPVPVPPEVEPLPDLPLVPGTVPELARRAQALFQQAQEYQQQGNWAGYGEALDALENIIQELVETSQDVSEAPGLPD